MGDDDAGGHGSVRYTYALQHQHGRSSSASSTGSGGRTSRPNLTGPADCMQSMQHTGDQAPARRRHAGDNDTDGRDSVRYIYTHTRRAAASARPATAAAATFCFRLGPIGSAAFGSEHTKPVLSRWSCTHGPRSCCRGGQHRGSVMSATGSDINTEILGIGGRWNRYQRRGGHS